MKILVIVLCLLCVCLVCAGCPYLRTVGESGEVILTLDPNAVGPWLDAAYATGQASASIGTATGNPALIGGGILLTTIITVLGAGFLGRKK